VVDPNFSN